eukprot:3537776-Pyramimonas_sp.AAC.2
MAQGIPRCLIMTPTILQDVPSPLQGRPPVAKELPQEAPKRPKHTEILYGWFSRLFASDGHPRPQDGSEMTQEGPKKDAIEPQNGP